MSNGSDTGLHYIADCIYCIGSLIAESDKLTVVVVAAQAHFIEAHNEHLTGKQVLEDKRLLWRVDEYIRRDKTAIRPLKGLSFDTIFREVSNQHKEAANLPALHLTLTH